MIIAAEDMPCLAVSLTSSATGPRTLTNSDIRCLRPFVLSTLTPLREMHNVSAGKIEPLLDRIATPAGVAVRPAQALEAVALASGRSFEAERIGIVTARATS